MKPEVNINTIHTALARTEDISLATVKRRASRESWIGRETDGRGRGGKVKVYLSSMLPVDVREALNNTNLPGGRQNTLPSLEARQNLDLKMAQERNAYAKYELAKAYSARVAEAGYGHKAEAKRLFIQSYNLGEAGSFPAVYNIIGKVDDKGKTIDGWVAKLNKNRWDPMCLADRRGYVGKGKRSVTQDQVKIILSIVQSPLNVPGKPIAEIVRQAREVMENRGMSPLSESTYRRWLTQDWIPKNYDQWIWWREGDKGLNDKVLFNLTRDYDKVEVGDMLVADGHVLNFDIINPETGKPKRMMLVLFIDFKSMYPLGWEIAPTENTGAISIALRRAILRLGKIPKVVYIDNGRAFKGKYFINKESAHELKGLYERIGIKHVIIAWAYHGQSKTIERFFGIMSELERLLPTYVGTSIENKPVHLNRGEKLRRRLHEKITDGLSMTLGNAHRCLSVWFDKYVNTPKGKKAQLAGKTPAELMVPGPGVDPVALRCLMMKSEPRQIQSNGVNLFGEWYYSPDLYGKRFITICRYDFLYNDSILVYEKDTEQFVCEAFKMSKVHPIVSVMGTEADKAEYQRQIEMKRAGRKQTVATAREIVETQVLPESRKRIEDAGLQLERGHVNGKSALPESKPEPVDEEQVKKDLARLMSFKEDENQHFLNTLRDLPESDRFEKLLEAEARGWILPKEYEAWMSYFEQTPEYQRHQGYFEEYRAKMVLAYGGESTGT